MTGPEMKMIRIRLGLTAKQMAHLLGYAGKNLHVLTYGLEGGHRRIREPQERLLRAYEAGYRPPDWPRSAGGL